MAATAPHPVPSTTTRSFRCLRSEFFSNRSCGHVVRQLTNQTDAWGRLGLGKVLVTPHLHNFLLGLRMEPCIDEMKRSCCGHASSQHLPHPAPSLVPRLGHLRNQRPCVITFNPGIGTSDQKQPGGLHRPTCDGLGSVLTEQTRGPARQWRVRGARTTSSRQTTGAGRLPHWSTAMVLSSKI